MTETLPTTETTSRYIDTADVAKLVRKHLKKEFPGVKFSVRTDRYAGGSSVDVKWTDGPTANTVDAVIAPFSGAKFDGMIDLKYHARTWYCPEHGARVGATYGHGMGDDGPVDSRCCHRAELVSMGADYVQSHRNYSPEFRAAMEAQTARETGLPYDPSTYLEQDRMWMSQRMAMLCAETAR